MSAAPGPRRDLFPAERQSICLEPKLSLRMRTKVAGLSFVNCYCPDKEVILTGSLEQIVKCETEK